MANEFIARKGLIALDSSQITGSLSITGAITGSIFTGSFKGDGSQLGGVTTASYIEYNNIANKPALVSSSAQISNFGIFATTGSNGFNGSQSITGSLTVTGQVVAQTLNVQQVTSSIVYSSGSNIFGNSVSNTQQFTGSMLVTGSLAVTGAGTFSSNVTAGGGNAPTLGFQLTTTTGTSTPRITNDNVNATVIRTGASGSPVVINNFANSSELVRFTDSGNVGIGTASPTERFEVAGLNGNIRLYGRSGISNNSISSNLYYNGSAWVRDNASFGAADINFGSSNDTIIFSTNSATSGSVTERMRITSGGNVFIGSTSGTTLNDLTNRLSVSSTSYNLFDISRFSNNAFGPNFYLVKSRNGSIGGNTIVESGDNLGNIIWTGANGTGFTDAAAIKAEVDGIPGASNDMPGRLVFSTTADGAGSATERMRITSGGNVVIGNTVASNVGLTIFGSNAATIYQTSNTGTGAGNGFYVGHTGDISYIWNYNNFPTVFATNNTERMRITSTGTVQPGANGTQDLGTSSLRWATVYTSDLSLSNGIGDYTIVEGEHDLFLYNNKNNKVYKFLVEEVDPSTATPKKS